MAIKTFFPNLTPSNHKLTSEKDVAYNCVAWALGLDDIWLQPHVPYTWPGQYLPLTEEPSPDDVAGLFVNRGFEVCDSPEFEHGYDRVALYAMRDRFTHVCRQLEGGWWASKIGDLEDIEHDTLDVLEGGAYGSVAVILRRSRLWESQITPET